MLRERVLSSALILSLLLSVIPCYAFAAEGGQTSDDIGTSTQVSPDTELPADSESTVPLRTSARSAITSIHVDHGKGLTKVDFSSAIEGFTVSSNGQDIPTYTYDIAVVPGTESITLSYTGVVGTGGGFSLTKITESQIVFTENQSVSVDVFSVRTAGNRPFYTKQATYTFCFTVAQEDPNAPVITLDLSGEKSTYLEGAPASTLIVEAEAVNGGTLSYQWYTGETSDDVSTVLEGENTNQFLPFTANTGVFYYKIKIINTLLDGATAQTDSTIAKIVVKDPQVAFELSALQTVTSGDTTQPIKKESDTVFSVAWQGTTQSDNSLRTFAPFQITGSIPDGGTLNKVWGGTTADTFDLIKDGALLIDEDRNIFTLDLSKAATGDGANYMRSTFIHNRGRCLYFSLEGDSTVYTLVVDCNNITDVATSPISVSLHDVDTHTYPEEFQIVNLQSAEAKASIFRGSLASNTPIVLQAQVWNQGHEMTVAGNARTLDWPDGQRNWVIVNGERLSDFYSADGGDSGQVFSQKFTLKPGLNVVEVYSNTYAFTLMTGTRNTNNLPVISAKDSDGKTDLSRTNSVVYLIDYDGAAASIVEGSDVSIATVRAVQHGKKDTAMTDLPFTWDGEKGQYVLTVPESFNDPDDTDTAGVIGNKYCHAVILSVKPTDAAASAEVISETANSDPLVVGTVSPCFFLDMNALKEDKTFSIRITAADGTSKQYKVQVQYASSDAAISGVSIEGPILDTTFNSETFAYYLEYSGADTQNGAMTISVPKEATAQVNGTPYSGGKISLDPKADFYQIEITAADQYTTNSYYFVTRYADGTIPFATISQASKDQAKKMLAKWYPTLETSEWLSSYWLIFMANATGTRSGASYDFNGKYVYDVNRHNFRQATDWAACILELVMLGENPYNFNGVNYVEGMEKCGGGAFANNVWYVMAAKAAGIDLRYLDVTKTGALKTNSDLDTRAWQIASLSGLVETKDMVRYVDSLHDCQDTDGKYIGLFTNQGYHGAVSGNGYTLGCVLSAIASAGADPDVQFLYKGYAPLDQIETTMYEDGQFRGGDGILQFPKDMVIGLGDIIQGSNVWARYALTEEKYHDLIAKAQENSVSIPSNMPTYGAEGYGKAYYDLYDAVVEATDDTSMRPEVVWGMPYQLFEDAVAALPGSIKEADLPAVKGAITQYEALDDANKQAVSKDTLTAYRAAVAAALDVKDPTRAVSGLYKRILALRDPLLISQADRPEVESIRKAYSAMDGNLQGMLDWAGPSVLQRLGKAEAALGGTGEEPEVKPQKMTITFELLGAPNDGESGTVNTLKAGNLETWHTGTYTFNAESLSAEEAFRVIMGDAGIAWRGDSANSFGTLYVSGIQNPKTGEWLEEFTTTANSGWMYTVNGTHPNVGMSNYTLHDGNRLVVHFTDDYTVEQGSEAWNPPVTKPKDPTAPSVSVDASMGKDGVASGTMSGDAVTDFVKALESATDAKGTIASIELTVPKDSKGVQLTVPRAVLKALANTQYTSFEVRSDAGSVTLDPTALAAVVKTAGSGEVVLRIAPAQVKPDAATKDLVGDRPIFEVTLKAGGKAVIDLGGTATLALPYTPAKGEDTARLTVLYLPEVGKAQEMEGAKYDKTQKGLVFSTPHLSTFAIALQSETPLPFTDVKQSDWFYDAVVYAYRSKLFNGTTGTAFSPNGTMTRAMLVTVLWRLEGEPEATAPAAFADVTPGAWYAGAVAWAGEKGIVTGDGSGFSPEGEVTREQIASILYRYAKIKGYDVSGTADLSAFADGAAVSAWAARAMQWANAAGLITGKSAAALDGAGTATRAEVAAILQRLTALAGEK